MNDAERRLLLLPKLQHGDENPDPGAVDIGKLLQIQRQIQCRVIDNRLQQVAEPPAAAKSRSLANALSLDVRLAASLH